MIDIRVHTKTDYAVLPDIDSPAMKVLDDTDWECLDEIGELLIAKGANDRFGITLAFPDQRQRNYGREIAS